MTATRIQLREDVRRVVDEALADSFSHNDWDAYELAKSKLSAICGWDAPAELYDQYQYDMAIAAYIKAAGI